MQTVSRGLGVPLIEVYRVASFYKAFRLKPAGKIVLTMCMGTACHVRQARLLLDQAMANSGSNRAKSPRMVFSPSRRSTAWAPAPWGRSSGKTGHIITT